MADYTGTSISSLNYFLRNNPVEDGLIQPDTILRAPLLRALEDRMIKGDFRGANAEVEIMTAMGLTGGPTTDKTAIRAVADDSYLTGYAPMREIEVNVGTTMGAINAAKGMPDSWTGLVTQKLANRKLDWDLTLDQILAGNGSGLRGIVYSSSYATLVLTIYLSNTYRETGWENAANLRVGQRIEILHSAAAVADSSGATDFKITEVFFGNRDNGAAVNTGYIKVTVASDISASCTNADLLYIRGGITLGVTLPEPHGLIALIQGNGDAYAGTSALTTFQTFTRANHPSMKSLVWDAGDFTSDGTPGVPDDFELRTLATFINEIKRGSGADTPDLMLCSSLMAQTLAEKNRQNQGVNVAVRTVQNAGEQQSMVIGVEYARTFRTGGRDIEIAVADTVPDNVIHFIKRSDLRWMVRNPGFHNVAAEFGIGDVWMPSKGDRLNAIEAPFRGEMQIMAHRLDRCGTLQDLIAA